MYESAMNEDTVKKEINPESLRACRVCLAWDMRLYGIHEWGLGDMYMEVTGATLSAWDGFPQHVCAWCRAQLLKAHALRARSRRADTLLRQALAHQHAITDSFIRTIDRSIHKLTHTLSDENSKNSALFYCIYDEQEPTDSKFDILIENNIQTNLENNTEDIKEDDLNCDDIGDVDSFINDCTNEFSSEDNNTKINEQNNIELHKFDDIVTNTDAEIVATTLEPITDKATKTRKRPVKQKTERKPKRRKTKEDTLKQKTERKLTRRKMKEDTLKQKTERKPTRRKATEDRTYIEDTDKDVKVKKRKPQKYKDRFVTDDDIKEFEKKYNVQLQFLTEEEMLKDMEERKESDSYQRAEFKCELCFKGFTAPKSYYNHVKSHAEVRGEYECHLCHWRYERPGRLRDHMRYMHRIKFLCVLCGKRNYGIEPVELHAAFHAGTTFPCNYCDKQFPKKTSCWTHMRNAHPLENAAIGTCDLCGEIFTSRKGLKMHKTRSHRESNDKSLFCRKCRVQFENKEAFQKHKDLQPGRRCHNTHSACQKCGALCSSEDELTTHKQDAHGIELFTCDDCNKSFLSKTSLSVHIDRLHLKIKRPLGLYSNYTPMVTDDRRHEPKERACVCEICGRAYACLAKLRTHQMTHTGDRPFKCAQCPRGFLNACVLRNHVDTMHKRLRKWKCPECPKTFLHQSSVNVHRLIHTGKKTKMCSYCGKAFLQSGSLITHVKYVHLKVTPPPRKRSKKKNA